MRARLHVHSMVTYVGNVIHVAGKSARATCNRRVRLEKGLKSELQRRRVAAPFSTAVSSPEAPIQKLKYDSWTKISTEHALPYEARVDWLRGLARVPESWELQLQTSQFVFDVDGKLDASDIFRLEDVRADMTIRQVLGHVSRWMGKYASPLAQAVDEKQLRLAILEDSPSPPQLHPATGAEPQYQIGDRVRLVTLRSRMKRSRPPRRKRWPCSA